jgi:hypothetical protein
LIKGNAFRIRHVKVVVQKAGCLELPSKLVLIPSVGILATETILQILRILQLKLRVQLVGSRAAGTWIYRGLIPALLKQLKINSMQSIPLRNYIFITKNPTSIVDLIKKALWT